MSAAERRGAYVAPVSQKDMEQQFGVGVRGKKRITVTTAPRVGRSAVEYKVKKPVATVSSTR